MKSIAVFHGVLYNVCMAKVKIVEQEQSFTDVYNKFVEQLTYIFRHRSLWKSEEDLQSLITLFRDYLRENLYGDLSETIKRDICRFVIIEILPFLSRKIESLNIESPNITLLNVWVDFKDDFLAVASYRSLTHFAQYMEIDDEDKNVVWKYNLNTMGGIFYYANSMILNYKYHKMVKQCPTGYGKTKSDNIIISFILGYNINADIFKLVGNPSLIPLQVNSIANMLMSKRYSKVFPLFAQYEGDPNRMFKIYQVKNGVLQLTHSKITNLSIFNKETALDGGRYSYQFYDDITRSRQRENVYQHLKDIDLYESEWKLRMYDEHRTLVFATGTSYHAQDFLSYLINNFSDNEPLHVDRATNSYSWTKYCHLTKDNDAVIIKVPKLDENDESTFPEKYTTKNAIKSRETNLRRFQAMEQQCPMPPLDLPFDWAYLQQYKELPEEIRNNDCRCFALCDPTRKGKNYLAVGIFKEGRNKLWYLTDVFYEKTMFKSAIDRIVSKLVKHQVDCLKIEINTTDLCVLKTFSDKCALLGNTGIVVQDFYSNQNKEQKIIEMQDDIKERIVFPEKGMYAESSPMGVAMQHLVSYSLAEKVPYDDIIDLLAMFVQQFLLTSTTNTMQVLSRSLLF